MKFLVDTCILSELAKPKCNEKVRKAFLPIESNMLFISSVTIGEIVKGIFLLPHTKKRKSLADWLLSIESSFERQVLPFDKDTAVIWGELSASLKLKGINISSTDRQIAATALQHGLHIMTRNVKDFEHTGALIINPFEDEA